MPNRTVKLNREWVLGEQIGEGGFGRVFLAEGEKGERAVVKLIPKTPGADRELLFVKLDGARNVVPVIDSGEIDRKWAIVMPRAEKSLRQHIDQTPQMGADDVVAILVDVATALADLDSKVVHRDLKPDNILLLDGSWCLADFGISRYAEASTAADTRKFALSPMYAGPERWRNEHAAISTDVYSIGVIAFELLEGRRPFPGPHTEDFREQHLHIDAPDPKHGSPALRGIVRECLYKAPGARPSPGNLLARLQRLGQEAPGGGLALLREAHLAEVAQRSETERLASENRSASERRTELYRSALAGGKAIEQALLAAIKDAAPAAAEQRGMHGGACLVFGPAEIEFFPIREVPLDPWEWTPPAFDVVAGTGIVVRIPMKNGFKGRSHSLWFCDAEQVGRFQWYEIAFMPSPLLGGSSNMRPFMLDPGPEAAKALWNGLAELQLAWPLTPLDVSQLDDFIDRWASWFAAAALGRLEPPSSMPERPTPRNWRHV